MSAAELMSMLAPHGPRITGMGFGGIPSLTPQDIAGALGMGGLDRPAYWFGLLKYAGDDSVAHRVNQCIRIGVGAIAKDQGWKLTDRELACLCEITLREGLTSPVCPACNGSGSVAAKDCERCHGVGRIPMSSRQRAAWMGVPETTWRRVWKPRADDCYRIVVRWESAVEMHLRKHFWHGY